MADDRIRERAYQLWQEEGEPHGRDEDHWHRAASEVSGGDQPAAALEDAHPDETQPEGAGTPAADLPAAGASSAAPTASAEAPPAATGKASPARAAKPRSTSAAPADGAATKRPRKPKA